MPLLRELRGLSFLSRFEGVRIRTVYYRFGLCVGLMRRLFLGVVIVLLSFGVAHHHYSLVRSSASFEDRVGGLRLGDFFDYSWKRNFSLRLNSVSGERGLMVKQEAETVKKKDVFGGEFGDFLREVKTREKPSYYDDLIRTVVPVVRQTRQDYKLPVRVRSQVGTIAKRLRDKGIKDVRAYSRTVGGKHYAIIALVEKLAE